MFFSNREFFILILFQTFWISFSDDNFIVTPNDWEVITKNWPKVSDQIGQEFFYTNKIDDNLIIKIHEKIKDKITLINQRIRLSFKYWQNPADKNNENPTTIIKYKSMNGSQITELVSVNYDDYFAGNWIELSYVLSRNQLDDFIITIRTAGDDPIVALKDIKVEYNTWTSSNSPSHNTNPKPNEIKPAVTLEAQPISGPTKKFEQCLFNRRTKECFHNEINYENLEAVINEFDQTDTCFELEYSSTDPTMIDAYFKIDKESLENKFFSTKLNTYAKYETAKICLKDYLRIKSSKIIVFFVVNNINKNKDDLKLRISKMNRGTTEIINYKFIPSNENSIGFKSWKTTENRAVTLNGNTFNVKSASNFPANYKIMSEWIEYNKNLNLKPMKFRYIVKNENQFNYFRVRPQICDEISNCFDAEIQFIKRADKLREIDYNFQPMNDTEFIKLVYEIEYYAPDFDKSGEISFDLEHLNFGDPCFGVQKQSPDSGFEQCFSDPMKSEPNIYHLRCKEGFANPENGCKDKNLCLVPDSFDIDGKKHSGEFYCAKEGSENMEHGLCSYESPTSISCICKKDNFINWKDKKCTETEVIIETSGWELKANRYIPKEKVKKLTFKFTKIRTDLFDICIIFDYISNSFTELLIHYNEKDIKYSIYLTESATKSSELSLVCINDFQLNPEQDFNVSFLVNDEKSLAGKFSISKPTFKIKPKQVVAKNLISKLEVIPNDHHSEILRDWTTPTVNSAVSYEIDVESNSGRKIRFITDWIKYNKNIKNLKNKIKFSVDKDNDINIFYGTISSEIPAVKNEGTISAKTKETEFILNPSTDFRFFVDFISKVQTTTPPPTVEKIKISIDYLKIGDPCESSPCRPFDCNPLSPENFSCKYEPDNCKNDPCSACPTIVKTTQDWSKKDNCVPTEKAYNCRVFDKYFKHDGKSCSQKYTYNSTSIVCDGLKCEIFDLIGKTKWADKNVPKVDSGNKLPLYFTSKNATEIDFGFKNVDDKSDVCFDLSYISGNESKLLIKSDDNQPLSFKKFEFSNEIQNKQKICLSYLSKIFTPKSQVKIISSLGKTEKLALNLDNFDKTGPKTSIEIDYLMRKIKNEDPAMKNFKYLDQWSIKSPEKSWDFAELENNQKIIFKVTKGTISSLLATKWIVKYEKGLRLRFNLKYISSSLLKSTLIINGFDEKMNETLISSIPIEQQTDKKPKYFNIQIPVYQTAFKIGFRMDTSFSNSGNEMENVFELSNIDIGDPCVTNDKVESEKSCSGAINAYCMRKSSVNSTSYSCNCKDSGTKGIDCELKDWCDSPQDFPAGSMKGSDYCEMINPKKNSKCNSGGVQGFYCSCAESEHWDAYNQKCSPTSKCGVNCQTTEFCNETKSECQCDFNRGFIPDTKDPKLCIKYDPCDDKQTQIYAKLKNIKILPSCGGAAQPNSICVNSGNLDSDQLPLHSCICKLGYQNAGGTGDDIDCKSNICDIPYLNGSICEQACINNNTIGFTCSCQSDKFYELKNNKCNLRSNVKCNCDVQSGSFCVDNENDCQCKQGYELLEKKCKPSLDKISLDTTFCPTGKATINNKTNEIECLCSDGYIWDEKAKMCAFEKLCSANSESRKECSIKKALCKIDFTKKNHLCYCPSGFFDMKINETHSECVSLCQMKMNDKSDYDKDCQDIDAVCDPTFMSGKEFKDIKTFIENNPKAQCVCNPGYYKDNNKCLIGQSVVKFTFGIKKTPGNSDQKAASNNIPDDMKRSPLYPMLLDQIEEIDNENKKVETDLTKDLQNKFKQREILTRVTKLIQNTIYKDSYLDSLVIVSCDTKDNDKDTCDFVLNLKKPFKEFKNFTEQILDTAFCVPIPSTDYCSISDIPPNKTPPPFALYDASESSGVLLVLAKKSFKPPVERKPCSSEKEKISCTGDSYCKPDPDDTGYSCVCNEKYFEPSKLSTDQGQTENYKCKLINNCDKECPGTKNGGYCINNIRRNSPTNITVDYICGCADKFRLSADKMECVDVCAKVSCSKNGKCQYTGRDGYQCLCDEGYYGESCEKQQTLSKGGWIAGIVVLAVLVVIVSGVAFMFARRSRNNSQPEMGRPMDDYTGSSYRVPSQSRGQSNPSFN